MTTAKSIIRRFNGEKTDIMGNYVGKICADRCVRKEFSEAGLGIRYTFVDGSAVFVDDVGVVEILTSFDGE